MSQDLNKFLDNLSNLENEKVKSRQSASNLENSVQKNTTESKNDRESQQVQIIKLQNNSEPELSIQSKNVSKTMLFRWKFKFQLLKTFWPPIRDFLIFLLIISFFISFPIILIIGILL